MTYKEDRAGVGGRPLKYGTVEELEKAINEYFKNCNEETEPMTITGLALALDVDRKTLCNYENKDEYFHTIKQAKLRVENAYEKRLVKRGNAGDIFALKNFSWDDKQIFDNTGNATQVVYIDVEEKKQTDTHIDEVINASNQ